jgi:hypothetical protein
MMAIPEPQRKRITRTIICQPQRKERKWLTIVSFSFSLIAAPNEGMAHREALDDYSLRLTEAHNLISIPNLLPDNEREKEQIGGRNERKVK